MAKALSRKVTIYINRKEVEATISSLTAKIKQLENEQKKLPIGTQEYMLFIICKDTKFQSNSQH